MNDKLHAHHVKLLREIEQWLEEANYIETQDRSMGYWCAEAADNIETLQRELEEAYKAIEEALALSSRDSVGVTRILRGALKREDSACRAAAQELIGQLERERDEARDWIKKAEHLTACFQPNISKITHPCVCGRDAVLKQIRGEGVERERDEAQAALTAGLEYHEQLQRERDEAEKARTQWQANAERNLRDIEYWKESSNREKFEKWEALEDVEKWIASCEEWREKHDRLRTAIEEAPHPMTCASMQEEVSCHYGSCDCWKRDALEGESDE